MYFFYQIRGQGRVCATANKIDGTQNNLIRETPIPQKDFPRSAHLPIFFVSLKNGRCVRGSTLNPERQKWKISNFSFLAFRTHWIFSNGKVRPSCYFGKSRTSVYEWRPHHKNFKTFPPWLQAPIKILSGKTEQSDDPIFVSRMRNAEACIPEKSSRIGYAEKLKKAVLDRRWKLDFSGCFPSLWYFSNNSDFCFCLYCFLHKAYSDFWVIMDRHKKPL